MLYLVLQKLQKIMIIQKINMKVTDITNGRNVIIFGANESSVVYANNKANNNFVMGDGIVQGINGTTLYA